MTRPAIKIALQYGLGLGLLTWVIVSNWHVESQGEEVGLARVLHEPVNWPAFVTAGVVYSASALVTFARWYILVRAQGLPFSLGSAVRLGLIGLYFSAFLPGSVGGDIVKAVAIAREQSRRTVAVATVGLDRVIGLAALFWLVTLVGTFLGFTGGIESLVDSETSRAALQGIVLITAGLSLGSLFFWLAMGFFAQGWSDRMALHLERLPKIGHASAELWRAVWLFRRRSGSVAMALGLSLVSHCGFVLAFFFAALAVLPKESIPAPASHFLIVPVGFAIQAGVPTPGGVGGAEYGFGALYHVIGFSFAAGALAALSYRIITWVLGLLGYLVYLRIRRRLVTVGEAAVATAE